MREKVKAQALQRGREVGKTTLARHIAAGSSGGLYLDLEDPVDLARLDSPLLALGGATGLVVIDEVQRRPELFEVLRVLIDRADSSAKWLLLGSASPSIVRGVSETLAGRLAFVDMGGFSLEETGVEKWRRLWIRGGFPRSFLAQDEPASFAWRQDFIRTFLERDLPQLGLGVPATTMRRSWTMLAHYHGQVLNAAELGRSLAISEASVRRYLHVLSGSYVVRQLQPWHENIKKRQVKSPKVYIRDSGLLHALLALETEPQLQSHPKVGASWEGFVVEQLLSDRSRRQAYFWATHAGAELDLLLVEGGRRLGVEIKYTDAPRLTKSMRTAFSDLKLDALYVAYPGEEAYPLAPGIMALPIAQLGQV